MHDKFSDPPTFVIEGPATQLYVLLGETSLLICGRGLDSNPQATITWIAPDGTTVMDNPRYDLDNGPDVVRLSIANTILSDAGVWRCDVTVQSEVNMLNGGRLISQNDTLIGSINVTIQLSVIGEIFRFVSLQKNCLFSDYSSSWSAKYSYH